MFKVWLVYRYFRGGQRLVNFTSFLAIFGMMLAVGSLVVSMGVLSGFWSTLRDSVINVTGHIMLSRSGALIRDPEAVEDQFKKVIGKDLQGYSPYVALEAVMAHKKNLAGVMVEGVDPDTISSALNLESRIHKGNLSFEEGEDGEPGAVVGKGVAKKFSLKLGDQFRVVIPRASRYDKEEIRPKVQKFVLRGVLDLGRQDFDSRYIVTSIGAAQKFGGYGEGVSGYWIKITDPNDSRKIAYKLTVNLGSGYWVRDWRDINSNLFEAVELEKMVIFLVLVILLIAASVNVVSTLFVSVLRRYPDISLLKTMGAQRRFVVRIFLGVGCLLGVIGSIGGMGIGLIACYGFEWAQDSLGIVRSEVYKLDRINVDVLFTDLLMIFAVTMGICILATLAPALKGARLSAVEGLKYE